MTTMRLKPQIFMYRFYPTRESRTRHIIEITRLRRNSVLTVEFELNGRQFLALNGGPFFKHSEAASIQVHCETQEEIDRLWGAITTNGGEESTCGWCKDSFGVSWQITPRILASKIYNADNSVADKAWSAMMSMRKIIIAGL